MADITTKKRNALPDAQFGWPEQRKFPLPDAAHVRNAASRLAQEVKAGRISPSTAAKIHKRIVAAGKRFGVEVTAADHSAAVPVAHPGPLKARRHLTRGRLEVSMDHPQHGRFEIRHMKDSSVLMYSHVDLGADAAAGDAPVWVQIATRGTFAGHGAGKFSLDDRTFDDIIRNFKNVDGGQVAFDYEHASEADGASGSVPIHGAPAQGWIKDLKVGNDGLYALVDWLEPAKSQIREGKYRFVSPAIRFGARHPVTNQPIGARLTSVALTNQPFLRGLKPLVAKDGAHEMHPNDELLGTDRPMSHRTLYSAHEFMPKIKACLGMHELSSPMECSERMKALREHYMAGQGEDHLGVPVGTYINQLRDEMGMPMTSTVEQMFDAVQEMIDAAIAEHVAELHPGETMTASEGDVGGGADGDVGMTGREALGDDPMSETTTLKDKLTAVEAEKATMTLQLNERNSKIEALEAENVALRDAASKRDAQELEDRVQEAFATHKDAQKLTEAHLTLMRVACKADRKAFEDVYPRIDFTKRHLMRSLAGAGKDVPLSSDHGTNVPGALVGESIMDTVVRLMRDNKGLTLEAAQNQAARLHSR